LSHTIQDPKVSELLQEQYRLQSRFRPALEDFITPSAIVADLSEAARPPILRSAASAFSQGVVGGERVVWRFETPPGAIAKIRSFTITNETNVSDLRVHFGPSFSVVPTTSAARRFTDGRVLGKGQQIPGGLLVYDTQVAAIAAYEWRRLFTAGETLTIHPNNWVCGTGNPTEFGFIEFEQSVVAGGTIFAMEWDEWSSP